MTKTFVVGIAVLLACFGSGMSRAIPTAGQTTTKQAKPGPFSTSPADVLIKEAEAADTKEGSREYAWQLTEMFVARKTGDGYIDKFSGRLSTADLMARRGERGWIPETAVARAFNDLMERIDGPSGEPLRTDTNVVHQLRITLSEISPALSTVKSHSSECLPTEAIVLLIQLLAHSGSLADRCPPTQGPSGALAQPACAGNADASVLIFRYSRSHSASEVKALFDHIAQLLGI